MEEKKGELKTISTFSKAINNDSDENRIELVKKVKSYHSLMTKNLLLIIEELQSFEDHPLSEDSLALIHADISERILDMCCTISSHTSKAAVNFLGSSNLSTEKLVNVFWRAF